MDIIIFTVGVRSPDLTKVQFPKSDRQMSDRHRFQYPFRHSVQDCDTKWNSFLLDSIRGKLQLFYRRLRLANDDDSGDDDDDDDDMVMMIMMMVVVVVVVVVIMVIITCGDN